MTSFSWHAALRPAVISVVLIVSACASNNNAQRIDDIEQRHGAKQAAFVAEQARFLASVDLDVPLEFGDLGSIELRRAELTGWSKRAFLRAEFTWVNTGPQTLRAPDVTLWIEDPESGARESRTLQLSVTFGLRYGTGSTYTAWIDVPTNGLERSPNWTWGIELEAPVDTAEG